MVTIRKTGGKVGGTAGVTSAPAPAPIAPVKPARPTRASLVEGLSLPTDFREPLDELGDYNWLIYGDPKIGKTSLTSRFPDPFHLMFEPGGKGLRIRDRVVSSWQEFQGYVQLIRSGKMYQNIMIDTSDKAYDFCFTYTAKRNGFEHPTDENDFGKSWGKIKTEFSDQMLTLAATGRGLVFVSHAKMSNELQNADGSKYTQIVPSMPKQALEFIGPWVDIIAYYGYFGNQRMLLINGTTDKVMSGHRIERHFLTPDGDRIQAIPMGDSADEAWANIVSAFNNEQEDICVPGRIENLAGTLAPKKKPGQR